MPRHSRVIATACSLLTMAGLSACGRQDGPGDAHESKAVKAGQVAADPLADRYVADHAGVPITQVPVARRQELLADLRHLRVAAAEGERVAAPELRQSIELARLEALARAAATKAGVFAEATEIELQRSYARYLQSREPGEYHVAHILVATRTLALDAIAELQQGATFADVARRRSADPTANNGGDLGWIRPGGLPIELTDAMQSLSIGSYTQKPVHTAYGWHVIDVIATRPATPLPLEQVRAQLIANLQQERYRSFLQRQADANR